MKSIVKIIGLITCIFLVLSGIVYLMINRHYASENGMRNVIMNRMVMDVEEGLQSGSFTGSDQIDSFIQKDSYIREYKKKDVPDEVIYYSLKDRSEEEKQESTPVTDENLILDDSGAEYLRPVKTEDGTLAGFLQFRYKSGNQKYTFEMAYLVLVISYFALLLIILIGYNVIVKPFNSLSEYPERLAKGRMGEGIPESKSRFFGKYIWGMNMLKDEMGLKDKNLSTLEREKQTLIVSIAHGIKTPLSNIKLYAEAIESGIYHEDKKPNEKDAETAAKIGQNVEKVEALVKEIMDSSVKAEISYTPTVTTFYLKELLELTKKEYSGRMEMLHIPFEMKCDNNPLVTSDKDGLFRIISQLMENAIKYGSGQGISISMGRQDEDVIISVKNKGTVLSEEETAYVFKSFWRGSNSKNVEGQGIGLYVSKRIAEGLGGDIFMKCWETENTTEVTLVIPIN